MELTLKKVDAKNIWPLTDLQVHSGQREFVASNTISILEAYTTITAGGHALPFGVYNGETPVGFLMIGYDCADWEAAPAIAAHNYCLWRLMIDGRYQGRGYGRRAAELIAEELRKIYPLPSRVTTQETTSLGEVSQSKAPAVLVEIGYHDNYADATWLEGHWDAIAQQLARALTRFFGLPFIYPITPI